MVEFISEIEEVEIEEPPVEAPEQEAAKSLEALVEEHVEEIQAVQQEQDYVDEPLPVQGEYHAPQESALDKAPSLKDELKPMVYDEKERVFVIDLFERYGKNQPEDDKWWKRQNLF